MEEDEGKRGKIRTLQEGKAGKPKGMLDTESSRWKKSKEPKVSGEQLGAVMPRLECRRVAKNEGKWRNVGGLQARQFVGVQTKTVCKGMSRVGVSKGWKK